eukprot:TRINITY_DN631_c0_g2_i1.p1 TRINITY_DN631_c0_g2~~TRINITY_DN631_c0_g2_i1.p1  ORF type:complete len:262 (-),score=17.53 TRINITY_DN631_c0_g2_i1:139-924(-)
MQGDKMPLHQLPLVYFSFAATIIFLAQVSSAANFVEELRIWKHHGVVFGPILVFGCHIFFWHGYGAIQAFMDRFKRDAWWKYKMHQRDKLGYASMLPRAILNQSTLLVAFLGVYYFSGRGFRLSTPLPGPVEIVSHTIVVLAIYEIIFYVTHRLLHTKTLFAYHALHHTTFGSVGVSGMYQHWIDYFLTTILALAVGPIVCDTHVVSLLLVTIIGSCNSIHSHGAYRFPFMPLPDDHELHHRNPRVNFATGPMDWLCGTYA